MDPEFGVTINNTGDNVSVLTDSASGYVLPTNTQNNDSANTVETATASTTTMNNNQSVHSESYNYDETVVDDAIEHINQELLFESPSNYPSNLPLAPITPMARFRTENDIEQNQDDEYDSDGLPPPPCAAYDSDEDEDGGFFQDALEEEILTNNNVTNIAVSSSISTRLESTTYDLQEQSNVTTGNLFTNEEISKMSVATLKEELKRRGVIGITHKPKQTLVNLLTNWVLENRFQQNQSFREQVPQPPITDTNHDSDNLVNTEINDAAPVADFRTNTSIETNIPNVNTQSIVPPTTSTPIINETGAHEVIAHFSPGAHWVELIPLPDAVPIPNNIDNSFRAPTTPEDEAAINRPRYDFAERFVREEF